MRGREDPHPTITGAVLDATRALLRITGASDARDIAVQLVRDAGGRVAPAADGEEGALPVDISFGCGPALLPLAPHASVERMVLERVLPGFVEDATRAIALAHHAAPRTGEAWTDPLTGLANRRASRRALDRTRPGDAVALVELDRLPGVVEASDDGGGDRLLCAFASLLHAELGQDDHAGRRGGDQLLVVLAATAPPGALAAVERLSTTWARTRPEPVTFSAGVACVDAPGAGIEAVEAADRALARAKAGGRGHTRVATAEDHR